MLDHGDGSSFTLCLLIEVHAEGMRSERRIITGSADEVVGVRFCFLNECASLSQGISQHAFEAEATSTEVYSDYGTELQTFECFGFNCFYWIRTLTMMMMMKVYEFFCFLFHRFVRWFHISW